MNLLGAPASRQPVGSLKPELAGETPALPARCVKAFSLAAQSGIFYSNSFAVTERAG
jgi:hypothetical protein